VDKDEFLKRLFSMFPTTFNENNLCYWTIGYETVLNKLKIDYEKLFYTMLTQYDKTNTAPSPKWIKENLSGCIIPDDKCKAVRHIETLRREEREPMPEHIKHKLEALKIKLTMGEKWLNTLIEN
jgi:hypothetical protein